MRENLGGARNILLFQVPHASEYVCTRSLHSVASLSLSAWWVNVYGILRPGGGGGEGTLIFSYIRRIGSFFGVQNFEFQYFLRFSEK